MLEVFVDFDGTITDVDTFDALVRAVAGDAAWEAIDGPLLAGRITLREALARQAAAVRLSRADWERLHQLAVSEGTSIQQLAVSGLSTIFASKGLPGLKS